MSRRRALGLALTLAAVALTGCNPFGRTYTYRYRITVEVDTPQGLRTGSSVWESSVEEGSGLGDNSRGLYARGQAVSVDLPTGTLFGLLRGPDMSLDYPTTIFGQTYRQAYQVPLSVDWRVLTKRIAADRRPLTLDARRYPLLVRFSDLNNPASVEKVDPNDLAASFGPGVRLRRIVVQVTDKSVTKGIEKRLPWLEQVGRRRATLIPNSPRYASEAQPIQLVSSSDFSTELYN